MRLTHPLDTLFDSAMKVRILRFLCRKGGEWNGRRLAAELSMNVTTTHHVLRQLREATVLDFRQVGNNFIYSLRDEHELVRACVRPLFAQEAQIAEQLYALLRHALGGRLRSRIVSVALYGSLARGQERPRSDIDLLVLVTSEEAKASARQALDQIGDTVLRAFGNPLAPYLNTVREAQRKTRQGLPLFRNILTSHQLLEGQPLEEVLHGRAA